MKRRYIILQLLGLCSVLPVFMATVSAQNNIVVRAQMDSAAIMMGDQTTVRLEVSQDKDKFVRLPPHVHVLRHRKFRKRGHFLKDHGYSP